MDASQLVTGLLGTMIGASLSAWLYHRRTMAVLRVQTTLQMFAAFETAEMQRARSEADKLLFQIRETNSNATWATLRSTLPDEEWHTIFAVRCFFDHLAVLHDSNIIDTRLCRAMWSEIYYMWHKHHFALLESTDDKDGALRHEWLHHTNEIVAWLVGSRTN